MMESRSNYHSYREGEWKFWVHARLWGPTLWEEISSHLKSSSPSDHPQTLRFRYPRGVDGSDYYLKIYHHSDPLGSIKDLFRVSKALRALRQSESLLREGFHTPLTVAAGEKRTARFIKMAFLLTLSVEGKLLPYFIQDHYLPLEDHSLIRKRVQIRHLAEDVRRLHQLGFIHGDLVPYNILVQSKEDEIQFFYLDNDRTRRYPRWISRELWKRNLVQLNRFSLPGITQRDRARFLCSYAGVERLGDRERRMARWLEGETRKRAQRMESK